MVIASAGHAVAHSPHPVQRSAMIDGSGGPPTRGVNRMASSAHASPQDWQCTKHLARQ
jgi:hypothetical protein